MLRPLSRYGKRRSFGFTLIEMAIVLGVAGLLFTGLWRLLATGNAQMRDQATASQHAQLAAAINTYLQSSEGQNFMAQINPLTTQNLTLPNNATCASSTNLGAFGAFPSHAGICSFIPPGFSTATANPYGQTYSVNILKDNTAAGTSPQTFSFMLITSGGETISDTSGGRISAMVGNDGGFIYSTDVCTPTGTFASTACGSYGSWSSGWATYGFAAGPGVGHIATRTFYAPSQNLSDYWLARKFVPGDSATAPVYNTMKTALFLGKDTTNAPNIFYLADSTTATAGGGTINMQGGLISGGGLSAINLTADATTTGSMLNIVAAGGTVMNNPLVNISNAGECNMTSPGVPLTCPYSAQVNTLTSTNLINAVTLYAQTFIYNTSDIRMKKDIQPLRNALNDIMQLKPVSFKFRADDKETMGVIAQDVEKIYPQLVVPGSAGMKAIAYDGLIAPMIESIQELKRENDDLRAQLKAQAARQQKLEQTLSVKPAVNP